MKENYLHFLWSKQFFTTPTFISEENEIIDIISPGTHNLNQGPDFIAAKVSINGQVWAGNIEIHTKSKDWLLHHHQFDTNYNNVILHVIWDDYLPIIDQTGRSIPTIRLKPNTKEQTSSNIEKLFNSKNEIPCEDSINKVPLSILNETIANSTHERYERKISAINSLKITNKKELLSLLIFQAFGGGVNTENFSQLALNIELKTLLKYRTNTFQIEALLLGWANLLNTDYPHEYYLALQKEWAFLKSKHNIKELTFIKWNYSKLRPFQFPTFKLAQLASLISSFEDLFQSINNFKEIDFKAFDIKASSFWEHHYSFKKKSPQHSTHLSKQFINSFKINTQILYQSLISEKPNTEIINSLKLIPKEQHRISKLLVNIGFQNKNAFDSQGLKELFTQKCYHKKCLTCSIGNHILLND